MSKSLISVKPGNRFRFAMKAIHAGTAVLLGAFASIASAQQLITPTPACAVTPPPYPGNGSGYALYPATPLVYPKTSDRYSVQYKLDNGAWTDAKVNISRYGGSNSSPYLSFSPYTQTTTSMSFVSIPARANALVQLRVTKLWDAPFLSSDRVSVRPSVKPVSTSLTQDGMVQLSTWTGADFAGEQFILWWNRNAQESGAIQGLAFFLDPPYSAPSVGVVKTVTSLSDLDPAGLAGYDTLVFQGTVPLSATGAQAYTVPNNINTIYLAPGSWLQGKLAFAPIPGGTSTASCTTSSSSSSSTACTRRIYGPGVLDVSRFEYDLRQCDPVSGYADQGYAALAAVNPSGSHRLDDFDLDGIIIADNNFYSTDSLTDSTVNNVKVIAWNANNDGLEFGSNTTASNVFVRSGDDSLKMWGSTDIVTNATVWQNFNGGVVNLGWFDNSPGDSGLIDGLYVVKTDWTTPTDPTWTADPADAVAHQNDAIIASMMIPGTQFGANQPSLYRNIFVEDPPQVLFSLKIIPSRSSANTDQINLMATSELNLNIENVFTPASIVGNSIGFQNLPSTYTFGSPLQTFPDGYTLAGSMKIGLTNVFIKLPEGIWLPLLGFDALPVGKLNPNGDDVEVNYGFELP
jgi:hypothetical protein